MLGIGPGKNRASPEWADIGVGDVVIGMDESHGAAGRSVTEPEGCLCGGSLVDEEFVAERADAVDVSITGPKVRNFGGALRCAVGFP